MHAFVSLCLSVSECVYVFVFIDSHVCVCVCKREIERKIMYAYQSQFASTQHEFIIHHFHAVKQHKLDLCFPPFTDNMTSDRAAQR